QGMGGGGLESKTKNGATPERGPHNTPGETRPPDDHPGPDRPMRVMRPRPAPTAPPGGNHPPTYANTETPWWDASQIYGTTPEHQQFVRAGQDGKLRVDADGLPPLPDDPATDPRMVPGFWLGLLMLQTLFTLEHNS